MGERTPIDTVITVSDNGRGMVPLDIPRIFELFRRVGKQDVPGEGMSASVKGRLKIELSPARSPA